MDINKANKSKNIRLNIEFTFTHQKKMLQKENMLNHVTSFVTKLLHSISITFLVH
jgi:hypothetical protein